MAKVPAVAKACTNRRPIAQRRSYNLPFISKPD